MFDITWTSHIYFIVVCYLYSSEEVTLRYLDLDCETTEQALDIIYFG